MTETVLVSVIACTCASQRVLLESFMTYTADCQQGPITFSLFWFLLLKLLNLSIANQNKRVWRHFRLVRLIRCIRQCTS